MHMDGEYFIIEAKKDLDEWEILYIEDFKPGVTRLHLRHFHPFGDSEFRLAYCVDKVLTREVLESLVK